MKIFVNKAPLEIFEGATVRDAVTKYSFERFGGETDNRYFVFDSFGNRVIPDGSLSEGEAVFVDFNL